MGGWSYKNIGADARPEHKKFVEKIFEYIGYTTEPADTGEGYAECTFWDPDVYGCIESICDEQSGHVKANFRSFKPEDLLYLLNALFPKTSVYYHSTEGNTVSDTWESHNRIYDADTMTLDCMDSYTDYGGDGPNGERSWKERFAINAPKPEYVQALIEFSTADGNVELTELLLELSRKLAEGFVNYEDDESDTRAVGVEYDVEEEGDVGRSDFENYDEDEYDEEDDEDEYDDKDDDDDGNINGFVIEDGVLERYKGNGRDMVIPEGVTAIGRWAFQYCTNLTSVTIPEGVTRIGEGAFQDCTGLTSVTIPGSVTEIGQSAFKGCAGLISVIIPERVTEIGWSAFEDCTSLTSVTIPEGVTEIWPAAFCSCTGLTNVIIPESVILIDELAFYGCTGLTSVTIPEGVTSIGNYAFKGCSGLTSVSIPESVTKIGMQAFLNCKLTISTPTGSYAEKYARENGIAVINY